MKKPPTHCPGPSAGITGPRRRDFLWRFGGGLGGAALASLLGTDRLLAATGASGSNGLLHQTGGLHRPAKAKRVIQLFMNGGMSPQDTFDFKPKLVELHGRPF